MNKKRILNIVIFIIIVIALDFMIGRTLRYYYFKAKSGYNYGTTYAMETTKADILVFGSSRASHHYVPEAFEDSLRMTFYDTGSDGIGILVQTAMLKSVLKRYTPKVIILDFFGNFEKNKNSFDSPATLLPYYKTHEEVRKTIESNGSFEKIKLISEIYPFNSQILAIAAGNAAVPEKEDKDYKGYVPLHREWQTEIDSIGSYNPHGLDSTLLHTFREFISIARTSGAKVVVIYSPIFEKYYRKQAIGICNEICSAEGVPFWDFSRDTLFLNNRRFFQDVLHLNDKGAKIFSAIVAEKVKNNVYYIQPGDNLGKN